MKTFVRWSLGAMAMLAISGCFVESDNEASEAKYTPDTPSQKEVASAWIIWIEAEKPGYEDMLIMVGLDKENKKISIRPVDYDTDSYKYVPLDDQNCIDHYNDVRRSGGVEKQTYYSRAQGGRKSVTLEINRSGGLIDLRYRVLDKEGNMVVYNHIVDRPNPDMGDFSNVYGREGLLDNGEDCDHISQSGEEGSAAP